MPQRMPGGRMPKRMGCLVRLALCLALGFVVVGCMVPVAGGLDEGEANRIVTALDRAGIEATKEGDPTVEGKFRVTVMKDDTQHAILTMQSEDLPRQRAPGVLDAVDKGVLVPSSAQEQAELV